jgi:methylenetetrahydrofolate reductase (NADPH)
MANLFRDKLENSSNFLLTFELVPGRTAKGRSVQKVLSFAQQAAKDGLLDALSITDNPSGNPSLSPDVLGREIKQIGIDPIIHFACRDWNRYGAFSRTLQLSRLAIENLLVVTGDYPAQGTEGTAKPCFDLDSATMICLLEGMNHGAGLFCQQGPKISEEKTDFLLGTVVSCFKHTESETINQYYKLLRKLHNGARFAVTQICYDARKFDELLQFVRANHGDMPIFGSVYILNERSARFINEGSVPGAYIPEKLLRQIQLEAKGQDRGKAASLLRSAKLVAILKGLGFRGAHISGAPVYEDIKTIILQFQEMKEQWREFLPEFSFPYPGGFYLYEKDEQSGLNTVRPVSRSCGSRRAYVSHMLMKVFHGLLFNKEAWHYPSLKRIASRIDRHSVPKALFCLLEDISKSLLFACQNCGDCALSDMAYLCPESQCPKFMRNGACGGSERAKCEVRKDKPCVWVKVYERLKAHGEESRLKDHCLPPRNWSLNWTSSWLNFYLDRDYHGAGLPFCERANRSL